MGIFDDLVGGDGKDEEELQENIEEIRDRVQGGQGVRDPQDQDKEVLEPPVRADELQGGRGERQDHSGPAESPEREKPSEDRGGNLSGGSPEVKSQAATRSPGTEETSSPDTGRDRGTPDIDTPETGSGGPTHEDVPEPPEVKDIDVPDIEKGPLFITVDKFRDALDAVSDLRRVAADMENYIGSMEGTLQEDRDTEEGVRRILDQAEKDTEDLKDIVSP
ncbi:MAG: hypothetical protein MUP63_02380 [Candidatus Nanohaloarchaeota archaeon QJJ-7]|nr:hypothetical protein [Candidatus Nanohaloarchaeota archaeon QJJ-7]